MQREPTCGEKGRSAGYQRARLTERWPNRGAAAPRPGELQGAPRRAAPGCEAGPAGRGTCGGWQGWACSVPFAMGIATRERGVRPVRRTSATASVRRKWYSGSDLWYPRPLACATSSSGHLRDLERRAAGGRKSGVRIGTSVCRAVRDGPNEFWAAARKRACTGGRGSHGRSAVVGGQCEQSATKKAWAGAPAESLAKKAFLAHHGSLPSKSGPTSVCERATAAGVN